jgi:hypothetical protein
MDMSTPCQLLGLGLDEIGRIVVPTTPLRVHGADPSKPYPARTRPAQPLAGTTMSTAPQTCRRTPL